MKQNVSKEELLSFMEAYAPKNLAQSWDNVGMLIDMGAVSYRKILVALDLSQRVVDEAIAKKADLIVTHHPILFQPIQSMSIFDVEQQLVMMCIQHGISHFAAHTNLDSAPKGINARLADLLELQDHRAVQPTERSFKKLVVFAPQSHAERVRMAMGDAGAGQLGPYSHCTFSVEGTGAFQPLEGANPFIGHEGTIEQVQEVRVESIVKPEQLAAVLQAVKDVHPYEEVAYDVYDMTIEEDVGLMRIGQLPKPLKGEEFCQWVKEKLKIPHVRAAGSMKKPVRRVAVASGSGFQDARQAQMQDADALVSAEMKHHMALHAVENGMLLVDAGHYETEQIICRYLIEGLQDRFHHVQYNTEFCLSEQEKAPIQTL